MSTRFQPPSNTSDELLRRCWRQQECGDCLRVQVAENSCSWCPSSASCVPNTARVQILAPMTDPLICPLESERWELRARPLGCHVSTITLFTCIVSVLSTFVVILLVATAVKLIRILAPHWKARSDGWWKVWRYYKPNWWRVWRIRRVDVDARDGVEPEQRPLLDAE